MPSNSSGVRWNVNRQKVSETVLDFAGDFIGAGKTPEERKNRLTSACTAWNYACVPEKVTAELLDKYVVEYRKWNPDAAAEECRLIRQDIERLIAQKQQKYSLVIKQIISGELTVVEGKDHIFVASTRQDLS